MQLGELPWADPDARFLAFTLASEDPEKEELHVLINMSDRSESVRLPGAQRMPLAPGSGHRRESPDDVVARDAQMPWTAPRYLSLPRSVVVLEAR